mmetsp:Transcript_28788/g.67971  ORF Transcript_28788/g.67971 Transcript_28788/m.67971 type:complete len:186 (+) Transcript_28788:206-763(+)
MPGNEPNDQFEEEDYCKAGRHQDVGCRRDIFLKLQVGGGQEYKTQKDLSAIFEKRNYGAPNGKGARQILGLCMKPPLCIVECHTEIRIAWVIVEGIEMEWEAQQVQTVCEMLTGEEYENSHLVEPQDLMQIQQLVFGFFHPPFRRSMGGTHNQSENVVLIEGAESCPSPVLNQCLFVDIDSLEEN